MTLSNVALTSTQFTEIRSFCLENADRIQNLKNSRYFSEGYDGYGVNEKKMEAQIAIWLETWLPQLGVEGLLELGQRLVNTGKYEEAGFAILIGRALRESWSRQTFDLIGKWWEDGGIRNWAQTDNGSAWLVAGHINKRIVQLDSLYKWYNSTSRWKRRAAAVAPIMVLRAQTYPLASLLDILEPVMTDHDKVVQQGVGSTLKQFMTSHRGQTEPFLRKWQDIAPRLIIRLATDKLTKAEKTTFMPGWREPIKPLIPLKLKAPLKPKPRAEPKPPDQTESTPPDQNETDGIIE